MEELITFGSHLHLDADRGIFLKDSSTLRDRAYFHKLAHVSGKNEPIFMKILS